MNSDLYHCIYCGCEINYVQDACSSCGAKISIGRYNKSIIVDKLNMTSNELENNDDSYDAFIALVILIVIFILPYFITEGFKHLIIISNLFNTSSKFFNNNNIFIEWMVGICIIFAFIFIPIFFYVIFSSINDLIKRFIKWLVIWRN